MKLGKEIKLNILPNYKTKVGTVNNKQSKSIYISLSAWGEINDVNQNTNYDSVVSGIRKKIKQNINSNVDKELFHNDKYIVDLDMRTSGFVNTKRSFMSCEITLLQKDRISVNNPQTVAVCNKLISDIIEDCFEENNYFKFYKTKK